MGSRGFFFSIVFLKVSFLAGGLEAVTHVKSSLKEKVL